MTSNAVYSPVSPKQINLSPTSLEDTHSALNFINPCHAKSSHIFKNVELNAPLVRENFLKNDKRFYSNIANSSSTETVSKKIKLTDNSQCILNENLSTALLCNPTPLTEELFHNNDLLSDPNEIDILTTEDLIEIISQTSKEMLVKFYGEGILDEPKNIIVNLKKYHGYLKSLDFNDQQILRILKSDVPEEKANLLINHFIIAPGFNTLREPGILIEHFTAVACGERNISEKEYIFLQCLDIFIYLGLLRETDKLPLILKMISGLRAP